jgi:putative ABC transport system permease protein
MRRLLALLRIPVLLVRFPAILLAVVGAMAVVSVASAANPLFLASAGTAAVQIDVSSQGPSIPAFSLIDYSSPEPDLAEYRERLLVPPLLRSGLGRPVRSVLGTQVQATATGASSGRPVVPMARDQALRHVTRVGTPGGQGGWVAQSVAEDLGVEVGDRLIIGAGNQRAMVRVAGVYVDLVDQPRSAFWAPLSGLVYPTTDDPDAPVPPPFFIMDRPALLDLQERLDGQGQFRWEFPVAGSKLTLPEAERLSDVIARTQSSVGDPATQLGSAFPGASYSSPVFDWVTEANQTVGAITGPVEAMSMAARIVALVVVAVAGAYAVQRRRVEFDLLDARGVSPIRLGLRTGAEAVIPAAAGAALGWVGAVAAVRALGPDPLLPPGTIGEALQQAGWTSGAGVVLLGLAAGISVRNREENRPGRLRSAATRLPWEAVALALAAASFYEIVTRGGGPVGAPDEPPEVDRLLLLFPILFVAGAAGVAVRGLRRILPRLRTARAGSAPAYLAIRRLAAAPRMALLMVTAGALAVGMLVYAGVLSTSIQGTAGDKALLSVGSDVALHLGGRGTAVPGVPNTPVERIEGAVLSPGGATVDVLAIDRSTFPDAAYWDPAVMGASLEDVMDALEPGPQERLPVIVVGDAETGDATVQVQGSGGLSLRVSMILRAFPGMRPGAGPVVADADGFFQTTQAARISVQPTHELWAKGPPDEVLAALEKHVSTDGATTASSAKETPRFLALAWTFGYLEALGVAAGVVALLGMVLYLQARQRDREVSYALARRMGLSSAAHGLSVAGELAGMLLAAFVIGAGLAVAAAGLIYGRLDPLPSLPPSPLLRLPLGLFGATAAVLVAAAAVGAWVVQRRADRANVAEVMRLAG